jgi:hypothetical protein
MEIPHIMHSSLRQVNPGSSAQLGGNQYLVGDYNSGTDVTGNFAGYTFPAFAGTGVYLVVVHFRMIESSRTANAGSEPLQVNKVNAVLMGPDGTDVTRDGQPYGAFPSEVVYECVDHVHTVSGGPSFQGMASNPGIAYGSTNTVGNSRRWQEDQQSFFIVDARRGDRLFVFRDYVPYTALTFEIVRLAPALMRYGAIEI